MKWRYRMLFDCLLAGLRSVSYTKKAHRVLKGHDILYYCKYILIKIFLLNPPSFYTPHSYILLLAYDQFKPSTIPCYFHIVHRPDILSDSQTKLNCDL